MLNMANEIPMTQSNPKTCRKLKWTLKMETILLELLVEQCLLIKKPESVFKNEQWSAIEQKFNVNLETNLRNDACKNKLRTCGFGRNEESHMAIINESLLDDYIMKELGIIVDNDFSEGACARTAAQLETDNDDDVEDVRKRL
ncbi:hypothetical protein AMTRI_Chr10g110 [Amborella trichopoda]